MFNLSTITSLFSNLTGGIYIYIALFLAGLGMGGYGGYRLEVGNLNALKLADANAMIQAVSQAKISQTASDTISKNLAVNLAKQTQQLQDQQKVTVIEIPKYVTLKQDATSCITYGLIRVLNATILQSSPDSIPLPSGKSNDSCTKINSSSLAESITDNYTQAEIAISEDTAWRNWYKQQAAVWNKHAQ